MNTKVGITIRLKGPRESGLLVRVHRGQWVYAARVVEGPDGKPVITSLTVDAPEGKSITPEVLRRFPSRKVLERARRWLGRLADVEVPPLSPKERQRLLAFVPPRGGRGSPRPPEFWAVVAADYLAALRDAPERPIAHLAERYEAEGAKGVTPPRVRDLVHMARTRGWLSGGWRGQGAGGAEATDKLKQWMEEQGEKRKRRRGGKG